MNVTISKDAEVTNLLVVLHSNVGTIYLEVLKPQQWKLIFNLELNFKNSDKTMKE